MDVAKHWDGGEGKDGALVGYLHDSWTNRPIFRFPSEGNAWGDWKRKQRGDGHAGECNVSQYRQLRVLVSGFGVRHTWVQIPAVAFPSCVTLDKELPASVPKFPHLENQTVVAPTTEGDWMGRTVNVKTLKMRVANDGPLGLIQPPLASVQPAS